jgi:hypothetical protein
MEVVVSLHLSRKSVGAIAAFLLAILIPTWAVAATAFQDTNFTLEGKITQHTAGKLTVSTEENIIFHVRYSDKTEIKRQDGSAGSEKDLRVGVMIHVDGDLGESGEISAQRIVIEADSAPPK